MKRRIIYKKAVENDNEQVRKFDNEDYPVRNDVLCPMLSQIPLRDFAILNFTAENDIRKYFTGDLEWIPYGVVELMLNSRIQTRNLSIHKISSFNSSLLLDYIYSSDIPASCDPGMLHVLIAADILNVSEDEIIEVARDEDELYNDHDGEKYVSIDWITKYYHECVDRIGLSCAVHIRNNEVDGKIEILIERGL